VTEQRRLISEIIKTTECHMTAEQIYMAAKAQMPSIAIGTVYRNLGLMEREGEIRRIPMPDAPDRFDKTTRLHDHLICRKCGNLEDVCIKNLMESFQEYPEIHVDSYELALYGICSACLVDGNE